MTKRLTAAFCTYNRADRLPELITALRAQQCSIPFDILVVDNNSEDATQEVLARLAKESGAVLNFVHEPEQGIPYARNRAVEECLAMGSDYMLFMDDDELPGDGLLENAIDALCREGAEVAGGRVEIKFPPGGRPAWLDDNLLGFLAEIDHGQESFWITDRSTPLWTANVAYQTRIFARDPELRFDPRYNRLGHAVGGGSDAIIFRAMIDRGLRIRYRPDMTVEHYVEEWRLHRRYFLKLHFVAGRKHGQFQTGDYPRTIYGVPVFMLQQAMAQWFQTAGMAVRRKPGLLRQAMNGTHALGLIWGRILRHRQRSQNT
ncbi:glycosyltransferase [Seongchinamella sediminis]|uniref:Glycosyltransferase n=1 Tax=Seongchinamella sediminis TaxID=2283635 RepID=A0A3L7DW35_9GAMM|nr:glycosyltransferase [Seongchinamella sediminis]RLQ20769.1 glycosyltransferase [Seongchinamella sediminis]